MAYSVLEVSADSVVGDEQLGSKPKFWFADGNDRWLFKERRPNTGEDWAEKVASELARLIGLNAAHVELARFGARIGCASKSFVLKETDTLVHGNEILGGQVEGYDPAKVQHHSDHTFENIVAAIQGLFPKENIWRMVLSQLASYLILDGLICNTDRHHENWGLLIKLEKPEADPPLYSLRVAPSFDHASSLGRELLEVAADKILADEVIGRYARKGRGGIYLRSSDKKGANPLHLVEFATRKFPDYFVPTLQKLGSTPLSLLQSTLDHVPDERISATGRQFAKDLLAYTYPALVGLAQ